MSIKKNYQLEMEREIERIRREGRRLKLVLHACCAPCSSAVLEQLKEVFEIEVYFYNPNISPREEYDHRLTELERLPDCLEAPEGIHVTGGPYDPDRYLGAIHGHERDPECGDRCSICYALRLEQTARYAKERGADYFTTTLSISPLKDAERLNSIGNALAEKYGVAYLFSDFKKRNGYRRSCELSAQFGLYRQDFCGCVYSRIERHPEALDPEGIRAYLNPDGIAGKLEYFDSIDSTNDRARSLAAQGAPDGTVVIADHQSAGRGRFQRRFYSPEGSGIYMSVLLRPDMRAEYARYLTAMTAVAVCRAIERSAGLEAKIKWVNDVYLYGKKTCGILCESALRMDGSGWMDYVVIGIGINCGRMEFPDELDSIATSVENALNRKEGFEKRRVSRSILTADVLNEMGEMLKQLREAQRREEIPGFMEEYAGRSCLNGLAVQVSRGNEVFEATVDHVEKTGKLLLRNGNGERIELESGEVSVHIVR